MTNVPITDDQLTEAAQSVTTALTNVHDAAGPRAAAFVAASIVRLAVDFLASTFGPDVAEAMLDDVQTYLKRTTEPPTQIASITPAGIV